MSRGSYASRILLFVVLILTMVYFIHFRWHITPNDIQQMITAFGWLSPFIFIAAYMAAPFMMFPAPVLSMSAGLAYGVWPGTLYIWLGAGGAAATGYLIGRFFGKAVFQFHQYSWSARAEERMNRQGFWFVLLLRLFPLMGFSMLSYLSGMTKVRFSTYLSATWIGILPGVFVYGTLGASLMAGDPLIIGSALLFLVILLSLSFFFRHKVKNWLDLEENKEKEG
ncbi:TVP38/TMEM64 family protein [Halobacillus sp. B29]|uniref:TVP38/TMEM64 family protein n=1 Tax=Halobacillus sp. B29 TaxID=3457432 RepID=UPI003FCC4A80